MTVKPSKAKSGNTMKALWRSVVYGLNLLLRCAYQ